MDDKDKIINQLSCAKENFAAIVEIMELVADLMERGYSQITPATKVANCENAFSTWSDIVRSMTWILRDEFDETVAKIVAMQKDIENDCKKPKRQKNVKKIGKV